MTMDLMPRNPKSSDCHFSTSHAAWAPLWSYVQHVAPKLAAKVKEPWTNDGDGLDAAHSLALAAILKKQLETGETTKFRIERERQLADLPDEACRTCEGTGRLRYAGNAGCGGCGGWRSKPGSGKARPFQCSLSFDVNRVHRFANFLEECGGFSIH